MKNLILNVDSYKYSHYRQRPKNTTEMSYYIEPRIGSNNMFPFTMFFGLQMFLKEYLVGQVITKEKVDEAEELVKLHGLPFNREGWEYIIDKYDGKLPIEIQALPEGTVVDNGNAVLQIVNTDPNLAWLSGFLETCLLRSIWYPSTVATNSFNIKKIILPFMTQTCDDLSGLGFKLNDFGFRGVSSYESGAIGGLAHLVNFAGTDTMGGVVYGEKYYNDPCAGFSIPAGEHSTYTPWGKINEMLAYYNMVEEFGNQMYAAVSDSWDIENAVRNIWGKQLKEKVLERGGTLVVRPDSGDPVQTPIKVVKWLAEDYGTTVNTKGYKVLNTVRVIQGDGIGDQEVFKILSELVSIGFSADNINFGMGNKLLQEVTRDSCNFTMKACEAVIEGIRVDVFKESPGKKSKKGRLAVVKRKEGLVTIREDELVKGSHGKETNYLRSVFKNGELLIEEDLQTIRDRTNQYL